MLFLANEFITCTGLRILTPGFLAAGKGSVQAFSPESLLAFATTPMLIQLRGMPLTHQQHQFITLLSAVQ